MMSIAFRVAASYGPVLKRGQEYAFVVLERYHSAYIA